MAIIGKVTRMQSVVDPASGNVIGWVIGYAVQDDKKGGAYLDTTVSVASTDQKPFDRWTKSEARRFALRYIHSREVRREATKDPETGDDVVKETVLKEDWLTQLTAQIDAQALSAKYGESFSV